MAIDGVRGLFVTGTDTGVGKTWVVARMTRDLRRQGRRVGVYKPVCTGASGTDDDNQIWDDVEALRDAVDREFPQTRICPQCFAAPLAPPVSAAAEGRRVDRDLLRSGVRWWHEQSELLLVEGVGGLLSPISDEDLVADLAADLGFPLLIVAANRLGTINQTLLTLEAARARELPVAGVIINCPLPDTKDASQTTNAEWIARFASVPILGTLQHEGVGQLRPDVVGDRMDWAAVAAYATPAA